MADLWGPYHATVTDVHDGDTLTLILDFGFNVAFTTRCRVYGINAPELATREGQDARDFALSLIKPGERCTVLSRGWDKYGGRFDGSITLADGRDFAGAMVNSGHAVDYTA